MTRIFQFATFVGLITYGLPGELRAQSMDNGTLHELIKVAVSCAPPNFVEKPEGNDPGVFDVTNTTYTGRSDMFAIEVSNKTSTYKRDNRNVRTSEKVVKYSIRWTDIGGVKTGLERGAEEVRFFFVSCKSGRQCVSTYDRIDGWWKTDRFSFFICDDSKVTNALADAVSRLAAVGVCSPNEAGDLVCGMPLEDDSN